MKLKRPLRGGEVGTDVRMIQRALNKWVRQTKGVIIEETGVYGKVTKSRVEAFEADRHLLSDGIFRQPTLDELWPFFDAYGRMRYAAFRPPRPESLLVFPLPAGAGGGVCQGLHQTAGLEGNWAMDFCADAGTAVLAPEAGRITKLSGHDPATAAPNPQGVYGWSTYVTTPKGYVYFVTHLGVRATLSVDMRVKAGDELGAVGNQLPFTGRPNHTHIGVTSPLGVTNAKKRITAVSRAPRLPEPV